jgi:pheromone shutdown protein TraB
VIVVIALVAALLPLYGLVEVWHGRWRPLWAALGFAVLVVAALVTADMWYPLFGFNHGDGQIFIGYFLFAGGLAAVAASALVAAPIVAVAARARARHLQKD